MVDVIVRKYIIVDKTYHVVARGTQKSKYLVPIGEKDFKPIVLYHNQEEAEKHTYSRWGFKDNFDSRTGDHYNLEPMPIDVRISEIDGKIFIYDIKL